MQLDGRRNFFIRDEKGGPFNERLYQIDKKGAIKIDCKKKKDRPSISEWEEQVVWMNDEKKSSKNIGGVQQKM